MNESVIAEVADTGSSPAVEETSPQPAIEGRWSQGLEWPAVLWIGVLHLGALAAPWCFSWEAFVLAVVLSFVTGCLGVTLGYHRLLTHSSFDTFPTVRRFLAWCGMMAGEGPPIMWVAVHRKHHYFSDQEEDPHTPRQGGGWSHVLWMLPRHNTSDWSKLYARYAPDLLRERFMRFLNKTFLWWQTLVGAAFFVAGWLIEDWRFGVSLLVYGMFVRLVYVMHITWLINSATHMWGYRNYETTDDSRNLWWVALLAYGEGWHNNHHAQQRSARHGHRWWEFDLTWVVICCMRTVGLAWNIVPPSSDGEPSDESTTPTP
jgi:fatty-acid desaturase